MTVAEESNQSFVTQLDLLMEYFKQHPNLDISHPEIVDWATSEYLKRTGKIFRDPDRGIRTLYQQGLLQKIKKGVYRYDPNDAHKRDPEDFSAALREAIFQRDGYRCVICGRGPREGLTLHADHIKPKEQGGKATLENGQTLCSEHNMFKQIFKQTETGKRLFIRLYDLAKAENNQSLLSFFTEVLHVYERNNINGHIVWKQ